jgi:hypothetical protein
VLIEAHFPYILACHLQTDADPDPFPAISICCGPETDPAFLVEADPDPDPHHTFQFDADRDRDLQHWFRTSGGQMRAFILGSFWVGFKRLVLFFKVSGMMSGFLVD